MCHFNCFTTMHGVHIFIKFLLFMFALRRFFWCECLDFRVSRDAYDRGDEIKLLTLKLKFPIGILLVTDCCGDHKPTFPDASLFLLVQVCDIDALEISIGYLICNSKTYLLYSQSWDIHIRGSKSDARLCNEISCHSTWLIVSTKLQLPDKFRFVLGLCLVSPGPSFWKPY